MVQRVIEGLSPVLVANRGEIAIRVMRTCRRLGLRTVGVYSDADSRSLHIAEADTVVRIGPAPAVESYLNQNAILDAAQQAGARAIHPGYGFLAENPDFAERVIDAGLVWVGPPPSAMRALGDKARAKALAEEQGVPLLPGYHGKDQSDLTLEAHAAGIGFPLLIKASAGGGGRGMRVVESLDAFGEALEAARREAQASFGDARVLLERYVRRPRHVEIQILGDAYGNLVHLGERECSVQRRHQKLIEESPSPAIDSALRQRMGDSALRLARAAGYANVGTVEFLLDERREFAFLEVNARLQVEHPVTEAVTGLDLVEQQLRVAAGESLGFTQGDVRFGGHAIEARVIAEDALAGWVPSSGRVSRFVAPVDARVDAWVRDGITVSPYYDSLLAKIVTYGLTRREAIQKMAHALKGTRVDGVTSNIDLLLATVETPEFLQGELHTRFLEDHRLAEQLAEVPSVALAAVSALDHFRTPRGDPWTSTRGWRFGRAGQPSTWLRAGRAHAAAISADLDGDGLYVEVGTTRHLVKPLVIDLRSRLSVDAQALTVWDETDWRVAELEGRSYRLERSHPLTVEETTHDRGAPAEAGSLTAPMPGRIVKLLVERGQRVDQNQPLIVLEAMKMEHVVEAPHAGEVAELRVAVGDQVQSGAHLLTLGSTVQ